MDGSFRWFDKNARKVGVGWDVKHILSGGDGIIYTVTSNNDLMWYRHDGRSDGSFRWFDNNARKVAVGWDVKHIFSDPTFFVPKPLKTPDRPGNPELGDPTGKGSELLETTGEHRFAAEERGFVSAGQLRPGDRISTHDQKGARVVSTIPRSAEATVYNLSVDRFQTFFIGGAVGPQPQRL
jgi:Tachylectin/Pretoxin HINT domain